MSPAGSHRVRLTLRLGERWWIKCSHYRSLIVSFYQFEINWSSSSVWPSVRRIRPRCFFCVVCHLVWLNNPILERQLLPHWSQGNTAAVSGGGLCCWCCSRPFVVRRCSLETWIRSSKHWQPSRMVRLQLPRSAANSSNVDGVDLNSFQWGLDCVFVALAWRTNRTFANRQFSKKNRAFGMQLSGIHATCPEIDWLHQLKLTTDCFLILRKKLPFQKLKRNCIILWETRNMFLWVMGSL